MTGFWKPCLTIMLASLWLASCATFDRILPRTEDPQVEKQRATVAMASLDDLEEIDSYIKLDNDLLRTQITEALEAQAALSGIFALDRLRVRFARQAIFLEGRLQIFSGETPVTADISGDVMLAFSGNQLIWLPRFDTLNILQKGFTLTGPAIDETETDEAAGWLDRANREIADALIVLDRNVINIAPMPLGHIEVGAKLTNLSNITATGSHNLGGVFTVAGTAILVEPSTTAIALDLGFVPNISSCPSDVFVSRSTFARSIRNREPEDVSRFMEFKQQRSHFFTEISGATQSTAVVHYWFADGEPVWLEELPVEPSYRWRTWSSMSIAPNDARHWEVIVVEKTTGCILHSQAISVDPLVALQSEEELPEATTYSDYRREFLSRTVAFSIQQQQPGIALIETRREFISDVLRNSVRDIQVVANFDTSRIEPKRLGGLLNPFDSSSIVCVESSCPPPEECGTTFSRCIQQRDTRDCNQCLFRNPLNNRCVNQGVDPICEAARTARNAIFESRFQACLSSEAEELQACNRLAQQVSKSCELEAGAELAACEETRETVNEFANSGPIATVDLKLETAGGLSAIFSGFELEGDMQGIRLNLALIGALDISGTLRFAPRRSLGSLTDCINPWQKSFKGKVMLPYEAQNMIGELESGPGEIYSPWSGFVLSAAMSPTPLEAMFVDSPGLLADCGIGLTVNDVLASLAGENRAYLAGAYAIEMQPLQTRIIMADASIKFGISSFTAPPELIENGLVYDIRK